MKQKAGRNKTIDTTVEEGLDWLAQCRTLTASTEDISEILDSVICDDFFETVQHLPAESVDLLIVDPPYNLTKTYGSQVFSKKRNEEYEAFTRTWLEAVLPLLKPEGTIYVCSDWQTSLLIGPILAEYVHLRSRITWQREKGRGSKDNWKNGMEDIWYGVKGKNFTFHVDAVKQRRPVIAPYRQNGKPKDWVESESGNYRDTCPSNFWDDISIPFWSMPENTAHPAQKPEKLLAKLILASSDPGDIVLDPFAGSGSTCVTARKLGRHFIGIEQEPQYCIWAMQRLAMAEEDTHIQGYEDGVFWQRNARELSNK